MQRRLLSSALLLLSLTLLFFGTLVPVASVSAAAANTCECWCGLRGDGARGYPGLDGMESCRVRCGNLNRSFLACSVAGDGSSPHTNLRCWAKEECEAANQEGEVTGYIADFQAAECLPGYTYCYPTEQPIKLSLKIGDISQVTGIGGFVSAFYRWLLGAAAVFSVLMIIVGGIQYMLSGGSASGVKVARERITNALIGVVILLGAYVLLATVNPQTLSLRTPAIPKVRPVETPGGANTCESYHDRGYKVEANGSTFHTGRLACGTEGELKKGPDGELLAEGKTCRFTQCSGNVGNQILTQCQQNAQIPSQSSCKKCEEVVFNEQTYPSPSATFCGAFKYPIAGTTQTRCLFVPPARNSAGLSQYNACGKVQFSCDSIKKCEDYMDATVVMANDTETLNTIANGSAFSAGFTGAVLSTFPFGNIVALAVSPTLRNIQQAPEPLQKLCEENPCLSQVGACTFISGGEHGPFVCRKPE